MWQVVGPMRQPFWGYLWGRCTNNPVTLFPTSLRRPPSLQVQEEEVCNATSLIPPTSAALFFLNLSFVTIYNHQGENQNCSSGFHKLPRGVCDELTNLSGQKKRQAGRGRGEKQ